MTDQQWEMLRSVARAYGVKVWSFYEDSGEPVEFDDGLRGELYENYHYDVIPEQIRKCCKEGRIYNACDMFAMHYIIFRIPGQKAGMVQYVMIGAFIEEPEKPDAVHIVEETGLELYHVKILKDYYCQTPTTYHLAKVIHAILQMMFPEFVWKMKKTDISLHEEQKDLHIRIQSDPQMSLKLIEERYRCENDVLEAVAQGDAARVEQAMHELGKYRIEARNSNNLWEAKNNLIIMNVLFRKAVERAGVHPYYIDELSTSIGKQIELAGNMRDIADLNRGFIRKYSLLVQNYAQKGYSQVIEDCINYIEFNLTEELNLDVLARRFSVHSSTLSKKFKHEMGETLTDYINERRVRASLPLLAATRLPVGEVAEKVGYLNENYYSRIFKKIQGMTPREYRNTMLGEGEQGKDRQ